MIRLARPTIEDDDLDAVKEVLGSGLLVQGARVAAFETELSRYVGTQHAVVVSNGTAALHLSLLALGVGPGDLVAVTAYSWPATANVIELCGATPLFLDIDPRTFNLDPNRLDEALAQVAARPAGSPRVRAVIPVHAFGQVADVAAILEIANRYEVPVIEDAACALGARFVGRPAGTWGRLGCFSFHPRKAITTGEGGVVVTDDAALARRVRVLRNHGQEPGVSPSDFVAPGFNYRMTEFQAALGSSQLKKIDRLIAARRRLAAGYGRLLQRTSVVPPFVTEGAEHVYQSYVTTLPADVAARRAELIRDLMRRGVETTIGTWHMPMTTYFRTRYGFSPGDFPATDRVFVASLALPIHEALSPSDQDLVVGALVAAAQGHTA